MISFIRFARLRYMCNSARILMTCASIRRAKHPRFAKPRRRFGLAMQTSLPRGCVAQKYVDERRMTCLNQQKHQSVHGDRRADLRDEWRYFFDDFCTGLTDTDTMRASACQTHGTDPTDGHSTCATILIPLCGIADPFAHEGCDDVVGDKRRGAKNLLRNPRHGLGS